MLSHESWTRILTGVPMWFVVMTILMGWVARSRMSNKHPNTLKMPRSHLIIGIIGLLLFGGTAVLSNIYSNGTETWWTTTGFIGFALVAFVLVIDCLVRRHQLTESGLRYGRWFGSSRDLQWSELRNVRYAAFKQCFRLEATNGDVAWIAASLTGLPEFARLVLSRAPSESIEDQTKEVLQATADGNPPSLW
jgi:hypothetical protein